MAAVDLKGVVKSYDGKLTVIHGIDLQIQHGEFSFPWPIVSAALIVAIVPIAVPSAIFQERVVGGLTQGGLKG